ncbi:MAG: TIGR03435 family protein [Bryobacterales bacterium]|nr:TIGR03435 family protein [Bryobacterales bacterium]
MHIPISLALAFACTLGAQTFDVASIKPNASGDLHRIGIQIQPGGRFAATGVPARILISMAYNVRDFQILNAPSWTSDQRYDINAKSESAGDQTSMEQIRPMLRALLAERFALKVREESRELPVYTLVEAKGGHKLKKSEEPAQRANRQFRFGRGQINAKGVPVNLLVQQIAQQLGRTVIDKTGIEGSFDVELNWTPDPGQGGVVIGSHGPGPGGGPGASGTGPGNALPAADSSGPTLFTALQEQLGLKLESSKGPVPVLVIENIERPTEN